MQANDILKFTSLIATIGELYGKEVSGELTDIYWQTLRRFEWEDLALAFGAHISNPDSGQFFPKPADIVRFIEGTGETKALQAWTKVEQAVRRVGGYCSLAFDDALIHRVLEDMGGWIKLCSLTLDALPFYANEFQKRYMGFVLKEPERYPPYLVGVIEQENAKNGYSRPSVVLIGNSEKAQEVIAKGNGASLMIQRCYSLENVLQKLSHLKKEEDNVKK